MKKTFLENVFVCEDLIFFVNIGFSGSTENAKAPPILEINQN